MTNLSTAHLSEEDRQRAADGSLDAADRARVLAHLDECRDCAADVARLTTLMTRIIDSRQASSTLASVPEDLWPDIRQQIERTKVVALEPSTEEVAWWRPRIDPWAIGVAASIAAVVAVTVIRTVPPAVRSAVTAAASSDSVFRFADDSIKRYQEQADRLLDDLKLERARLAPETQAAIDDDLKTVDLAIAELQAAITRDPRNPALRAMLASSYRQKVDVLKKIGNAS
jgi:anti-sigma factor RsiW